MNIEEQRQHEQLVANCNMLIKSNGLEQITDKLREKIFKKIEMAALDDQTTIMNGKYLLEAMHGIRRIIKSLAAEHIDNNPT